MFELDTRMFRAMSTAKQDCNCNQDEGIDVAKGLTDLMRLASTIEILITMIAALIALVTTFDEFNLILFNPSDVSERVTHCGTIDEMLMGSSKDIDNSKVFMFTANSTKFGENISRVYNIAGPTAPPCNALPAISVIVPVSNTKKELVRSTARPTMSLIASTSVLMSWNDVLVASMPGVKYPPVSVWEEKGVVRFVAIVILTGSNVDILIVSSKLNEMEQVVPSPFMLRLNEIIIGDVLSLVKLLTTNASELGIATTLLPAMSAIKDVVVVRKQFE